MKLYYLVMDYNGWTVYQTFDRDFLFMDYPFVTSCLDVANGMCVLFRKRNKNIYIPPNQKMLSISDVYLK